jgi:hypothetical protein
MSNWEKTEGFRPLTGKTPRGLGKNPEKTCQILSETVRIWQNPADLGSSGQAENLYVPTKKGVVNFGPLMR